MFLFTLIHVLVSGAQALIIGSGLLDVVQLNFSCTGEEPRLLNCPGAAEIIPPFQAAGNCPYAGVRCGMYIVCVYYFCASVGLY